MRLSGFPPPCYTRFMRLAGATLVLPFVLILLSGAYSRPVRSEPPRPASPPPPSLAPTGVAPKSEIGIAPSLCECAEKVQNGRP